MATPRRIWVYQGFVDLARREASIAGRRQSLSPTEVTLLAYLEERGGAPVARAELLREVWGYHERVVSRTLDTTIARLRAKIEEDPAAPRHLLTVAGEGYRFVPLGAAHGGRVGLGPLIGRVEAMRALDEAIGLGAPLITVCGLGGMGKSRLVAAWAEQRGIPLIELAPLPGPDPVRAAIAAALEVGDSTDWAGLGATVLSRGLPALVLDQMEHLLPEMLGPLQAFLGAHDAGTGRRPVLVCSSRVAIRLPGERLLEPGPLSPSEARALYELRRAGPSEADTDELLSRIGHIPLAVELAAARSRTLTAREQIRELGLDLLEDPDDPGRSIRRSIAGSWSFLNERERHGLRALVAFRGAFTVEAARAVLGGEPAESLAVLHALRECALVTRAPGEDSRMNVLEPIRWFVLEAIPEDEGAALRHATWFSRWREPTLRRALDTVDGAPRQALAAEAPELLAAVQTAIALGLGEIATGAWLGLFEVTRLDGHFAGEVARLGAQVLEVPGLSERSWLAVGARLADLQRRRGLSTVAMALAREAVERADALADADLAAFATHVLGIALLETDALDEAEAAGIKALRLARAADAPDLESVAHLLLSNIAGARGDHDTNRTHLLAACDWYRASGNRRAEGIILCNLGNLWHDLGKLDAAMETWDAALVLHRAVGDRRHEATVLANRALVFLARGDIDEAERSVRTAIRQHHAAQTRRCEAIALNLLADVLRRQGRPMEALLAARDAARLAAGTAWPALRQVAEATTAEIEGELGVTTDVVSRIQSVEGALQAEGYVAESLIATCRRGRVLLRAGDREGARDAEAAVAKVGTPNGEVALALDELRARLREEKLEV